MSLTSELVEAFQAVVGNPGTVAVQETKRQYSIRRKIKIPRLS